MVLKAKNGCWKKGERCQTHKHPSSFISSGEDSVGESRQSKKSTDRRGIWHYFPLLLCFFSFAHSLFVLFDQVLHVRVCVGGRAGSISETGLSLSAWVQVCFRLEMLSSLCVLECANWAAVLLGLGPDGNCFGEGKEKMEKSQKGGKIEVHTGTEIIIIKLYGTFSSKRV